MRPWRCLQIKCIAPRSATVLIEGETGVGKEMTAREIHAHSPRAGKPFVPVDCTAFASELIESQLFGHVKGAFTGAVSATLGMMRCADGGTLFLDEIGELPLPAQAKLLRCVQERTVVPLGGVEPIAIDIRIIAATHRDLARMVREGVFRQDLYFRINVIRVTIPPLRERPDDIVRLASHFVDELARFYQEPNKVISRRVSKCCFNTTGQATCANCAMPWSVRSYSATIVRSMLPTCRRDSRVRPTFVGKGGRPANPFRRWPRRNAC